MSSNLTTENSAHTYQEIPALGQSTNNMLMLLIWCQRMGNEVSEALQQWIHSDDARKLRQSLYQDVQGEQPIEQLVITMAALVSFPRSRPDHADDVKEPVHQSFLSDMTAWATDLPLGQCDEFAEVITFALIQVLEEEQLVNLAIFLATALDRDPPRFDLFYGMCHEYIRSKIHGRTTTRSHGDALKMVRHQFIAAGLSFGSWPTSPDQSSEVSRYSCDACRLKVC